VHQKVVEDSYSDSTYINSLVDIYTHKVIEKTQVNLFVTSWACTISL